MRDENELHCIFGDEDDVKAEDYKVEDCKEEDLPSFVLLKEDNPLVKICKDDMLLSFRQFSETYQVKRHL